MHHGIRKLIAAAMITAVPMLGVVACGNDNKTTVSDTAGGTSCFTQMDSNQKAQLTSYANKDGNQVKVNSNNPDGTQDVCILEPDGGGGYNERYYKEKDGFADYFLYSTLFGHSNALMTYGLLSGDLDVGDAMALSLLMGVNNKGGLYQPYQRTSAGWGYQPTVRNVTVTNVYYGSNGPRQSLGSAKPPSGYGTSKLPTKAPEAMAGSYVTDKNGKKVISQTATTGASKVLKDPSTVKLQDSKTVAPPRNVPNPAAATTVQPTTPPTPATTSKSQPAAPGGGRTTASNGPKPPVGNSSGGSKPSGKK